MSNLTVNVTLPPSLTLHDVGSTIILPYSATISVLKFPSSSTTNLNLVPLGLVMESRDSASFHINCVPLLLSANILFASAKL